jgi:aminomethyltransferase
MVSLGALLGWSSADGSTGIITSGTQSPSLGEAVAMGYVATADAEPGTMVDVEIRGQRVPAEVVALPFYKRPR